MSKAKLKIQRIVPDPYFVVEVRRKASVSQYGHYDSEVDAYALAERLAENDDIEWHPDEIRHYDDHGTPKSCSHCGSERLVCIHQEYTGCYCLMDFDVYCTQCGRLRGYWWCGEYASSYMLECGSVADKRAFERLYGPCETFSAEDYSDV